MIVKMKKTTILCRIEDRKDALEKLASLGFQEFSVSPPQIPFLKDRLRQCQVPVETG